MAQPFEYVAPNLAPYAASVAELLAHQHDAAARAAVATGDAQAAARAANGDVWGRAIAQAAQIPQQVMQQRRLEQDSAQKRELQAQQIETGKTEAAARTDATARATQQRLVTTIGTLAKGAADPEDFIGRVHDLSALGALPKDVAEHIAQQATSGDWASVQKRYVDFAAQFAKTVTLAPNAKAVNEFSGETTAANPIAKPPTMEELALQATGGNAGEALSRLHPPQQPTEAGLANAANDPTKTPEQRAAAKASLSDLQAPTMAGRDEAARHNAEIERIANLTAGREAARDAEIRRHNLAGEAANDAAPTLSEEAKHLVAKQFAMTGNLPPMGNGKQGAALRTAIFNDAADQFKGLDLASQKAAYDANKDSLKKLQVQRDAISAFEQTATKNIDIFLDTAGKVVDTGSPLANGLLRQATGKVLGSADQAAYDAARQVAVNEIAKITSNPNLSGTLSDSARHEIDAFNPQSATLAQSVKVMRLLKQDMANRASSMDEQIKAVQQRIAAPPGKQPSGSAPAVGSTRTVGADTLTWKTVNGQTGWYK